jgi:membrane-bound lytic murein transglycosylase A
MPSRAPADRKIGNAVEAAEAMTPGRIISIVLLLTLLGGTAWGGLAAASEEPFKLADTQLEPLDWSAVEGWPSDDHLAAFAAYKTSCQALRQSARVQEHAALLAALWETCRKALSAQPAEADGARRFFEENFTPVHIARLGESSGFVTGYYEPIVAGSRFPNPEFNVPLYRRPPDLVEAGHKPGSAPFPNRGALVGRRDHSSQIVPYHDRGAIEAGALDGQKLEICWLKDPFDALSAQIEGSARVILEDGTPLRISYDAHNGFPYSAIGRALVERNLMSREELSMQRIREWMAAHPDEAPRLRATNRSYIFFRITGLSNDGEPRGAQGVPLTPGRSIAVDRLHEYGTPFFIAADLPSEGATGASPFRRLMIAQDTGSAIVGPARADLYWGAGEEAGRIAGRIRHPARFVMLVPRELDIAGAVRQVPLPLPKPSISEVEVARSVPLPLPKPKIPELEAKQHGDNGRDAGSAKGEPQPSPGGKRQATPTRHRYRYYYFRI